MWALAAAEMAGLFQAGKGDIRQPVSPETEERISAEKKNLAALKRERKARKRLQLMKNSKPLPPRCSLAEGREHLLKEAKDDSE